MPGFDRWQATWDRLHAPAPPATVFEQLIACYSEPHRAYHTVQHLEECLEKLKELEDQAMHLGEVELGLWFHDAIYDVRATDNEARSADWARTVARDAGIEALAAERVHAVHDAVPSGDDQRILVFSTETFFGRYEAATRRNLERSIAKLS